MRKSSRRLGRGLSSLISRDDDVTQLGEATGVEATESDVREADTDATVPLSGTSRDDGRAGNEAIAAERSAETLALSEAASPDAALAGGGMADRSVDDARVGLGRATTFGVKEARGFIGIEARMVPVGELRPNRHQPRGPIDDEGCRELARSIALTGVIQPIVARQTFDGLEIVAGERRWRSSRLAGLKTVPVLIREATDEEMIELALVENIHREDLNAVDRARAYKQYCDVFELKAEEVAARLGEDRTTVTNYIRLLELPETVLSMLGAGRISMGHARSLLGAKTPMQQVELAEAVAAGGMSVRSLEELIRRGRRARQQKVPKAREFTSGGLPAHLKAIERKFEEVLSAKVSIELAETKSDGRVVIEFFGLDDFERICRKIGVLKKRDDSR